MKSLELNLNKRLLIVEADSIEQIESLKNIYKEYGEFLCKGSDLTEEAANTLTDAYYTCFVCGGDGLETCTNPDHGFINALSFHDVGRIGCPVCGHDPNHKIKNGGECECCNGSGKLNSFEFSHEANEYAYDDEGDYHTALESFISAIESKGYHWENPVKKPIKENYGYNENINVLDTPPEWDEECYYEDLDRWKEAESTTFNPEKCIIFEIL